MKIILVLLLLFSFSLVVFSGPTYVQQRIAVGTTGTIDDALPFNPTPGSTYIAIISRPATTTIDDIEGDDGDTHLNRISTVVYSGVIVEVWKANNVAGISRNFHVGMVGYDAVTVTFAEWAQN